MADVGMWGLGALACGAAFLGYLGARRLLARFKAVCVTVFMIAVLAAMLYGALWMWHAL